ncbi:unnamed protein product [Mycena citricolor]|uniref:Rab-GAP TBC domain-containing protein n=1 Tax=Mycena citricolor TaxID=2018698 RepID=A0AAD2GX54_9AGAR|nr:unnamed protein product [Mycena citricolor]
MRLLPLQQVEEALLGKLSPSSKIKNENGEEDPAPLPEVSVHSATQWKGAFTRLMNNVRGSVDGPEANEPMDSREARQLLHACAEDMVELWQDPTVKDVLRAHRLRLEDMAGFFLDSIERVTAMNYEPSDGVSEHHFNFKSSSTGNMVPHDWVIYDVGGARSLRAAWVPYFDDMDAIIFLSPISCFDQVLAEDESVNRLVLKTALQMIDCPLLKDTSLILFLNKCDMLKAKLASGQKFAEYVISYGDRPNDFESTSQCAIDFSLVVLDACANRAARHEEEIQHDRKAALAPTQKLLYIPDLRHVFVTCSSARISRRVVLFDALDLGTIFISHGIIFIFILSIIWNPLYLTSDSEMLVEDCTNEKARPFSCVLEHGRLENCTDCFPQDHLELPSEEHDREGDKESERNNSDEESPPDAKECIESLVLSFLHQLAFPFDRDQEDEDDERTSDSQSDEPRQKKQRKNKCKAKPIELQVSDRKAGGKTGHGERKIFRTAFSRPGCDARVRVGWGDSDETLVDDLAATFELERADLNVRATAKGLCCGSGFSLRLMSGTIVQATDTEGILIPPGEDIARIEVGEDIGWVLAVEKDAVFQTLSKARITAHPNLPRGILLTGKGYPDLATRSLLAALSASLPAKVCILGLADGDPHGVDILAVYRFGSQRMNHERESLRASRLKSIGVWAGEIIDKYGVERDALLPITVHDQKKALTMLQRTELPNRWKRELSLMLQTRKKAEIEVLEGRLLDYVVGKIKQKVENVVSTVMNVRPPPARPHIAIHPSTYSNSSSRNEWDDAWDSGSDSDEDAKYRASTSNLHRMSNTSSTSFNPRSSTSSLRQGAVAVPIKHKEASASTLAFSYTHVSAPNPSSYPPKNGWTIVKTKGCDEGGGSSPDAGDDISRSGQGEADNDADVEGDMILGEMDPDAMEAMAVIPPKPRADQGVVRQDVLDIVNDPLVAVRLRPRRKDPSPTRPSSPNSPQSRERSEKLMRERSIRTSRRHKFVECLSAQDVSIAELRKLSWAGIPADFRPMAWQLLLGYLPLPTPLRAVTLARKRSEYQSLVEVAFARNREGLDQQIWHQIEIDVPRTRPGVRLWMHAATQRLLERVLYVWAIRHPASGYVQGINDLVTPFVQVFLSAYVDSDPELFDPAILPQSALEAVEADAFWCLSRLLDGIQDNYISAQPGIQRSVRRMSELVARIDAPLSTHLATEGVEFMQFAFRWMNCLLMREISVRNTVRMWDTYLAEGPDAFSQFHLYVCSAFLVKWSEKLRQMDFQGIIMFLQSLPTQTWGDHEIEMLLSEAFVLNSIWANAQSHFGAPGL